MTIGITEGDVQHMLEIARQHGETADEALPWELLHALKSLVECAHLSAAGIDSRTMDCFAIQEVDPPSCSEEEKVELDAAFDRHYWRSICSYPDRTGDIESVTRRSDLMPDLEYRQTPMYVDYGRPLGVEHEIMVCLDAGRPQRTLRLLFARGRGSDFSDRDVAVLTLLRPHLQAAFVRAERERRGLLPLTVRQRQILEYVSAGYTNSQIATRLDLSQGTVRKHLENIFARLDVTSRTAAVAQLRPSI